MIRLGLRSIKPLKFTVASLVRSLSLGKRVLTGLLATTEKKEATP
jgi:hypothetical protein